MDYLGLRVRAFVFPAALVMILLVQFSYGFTDPRDVTAMNSLYVALQNPISLTGWIPNGGDPCLEAWKGVECVNSNITGIVLIGENLGGELSTNLDLFTSMIIIDLSNNHIGGTIPINLPLTMRNFDLSGNNFSGSIPGSLSSLSQLTDLSFNNNNLTGELPDAFQSLTSLVNLDFSSNNLSGLLPPSLGNMLSLTSLHLQDNHLSGSLDVLQDLPLQDLNIENNIFSGPIPEKLLTIPQFKKDGNPFNTTIIPSTPTPGPAPLPPSPGSRLTPGRVINGSSTPERPSPTEADKFWKARNFKWLVIGVALVLIIICLGLFLCMSKSRKGKQHADGLSKMSKMGGSASQMWKSQDIESFVQSNDVEEKVPKAAVLTHTEEHGVAVPSKGGILSQRDREKPGINTVGVLPKQNQKNEDTAGMDFTLMPPLAPMEINIRPVVPAVPTTGKAPIKSLNQTASARAFSVASLQQYTNSFSQDNLIGEGMLGRVYRAELPDGKLLAVKKLDEMASVFQNDEEFLGLVMSISKLQNANLLELEGYCLEHGQRLLIYGYYRNGTLHDALHSDGLTKKLSWNARIRIALGAARALEYLHEICQPPVVHRNFKSDNVLLSDDLAARVSDCGLAPLISAASESQLSRQLLSARGYGAPEFEMGTYSCQSDVYSFGVVMLELLTGRKAYDSLRPRVEQYLVRWAIPQLHDIDALSRMVDPFLNGAYPAKSLSRFADIISLCVQSEPEFRPPMSEIVQNLLHMVQREPPMRR